jgi:alpha-L-fucosidase
MKPFLISSALALLLSNPVLEAAVQDPSEGSLNRKDRLEWFQDQGFGLFIHWNIDCQIGSVISHSLVGASEDFCRRYFEDLPKTFNPRQFQPGDWADLAKLAGIRYVVLTTKHHAGFCLWQTKTTDFNVANTPFRRDIVGEVFDAFRKRGIAAGVYLSPDDFHWLWENKIPIQRGIDAVQPSANPGLLDLDRRQIKELLTKYGPVSMVFFDGQAEGLRELAWQLQPDTVVTRGAIPTPEQNVPGIALPGPWESCITMGHGWGYQPTLEKYKSAGDCIDLLVETRAKGGNLLLNVGPKPDGTLPPEQEERLREIALWMFVNHECIHGVRPWVITHEGDVWFTKAKDADTLYVIVKNRGDWNNGTWKEITLRSVRLTDQTEASVLGQNDSCLEYRPEVIPKTTCHQDSDGLHVRAMQSQRLRDDRYWPNPVVIKLTHVKPAFTPPNVETLEVKPDAAGNAVLCKGALSGPGSSEVVEVAFEYRDITGLDVHDRPNNWTPTKAPGPGRNGEFSSAVKGLVSGHRYEFRAVGRHPVLPVYGKTITVSIP